LRADAAGISRAQTNRTTGKSQRLIAPVGKSYRPRREHSVERRSLGIARAGRLGEKHGSLPEHFMIFDIIKAIVLGIVEGLTEFVPVSSTGHLLLVQRFFGFTDEDFGKTFAILIQFGAILALLSIYFVRLWQLAVGFFTDPAARRFVLGVLLAFLPAAVVGALAHDFIKAVLFNEWLICFTLIAGGAVLLWIDMLDLKPRHNDAQGFTLPMYFMIGLVQCVSMIPGVSRSGATIVGAMLLGADRRSAAEFSFWLAMPTMAGAFAYDLYKSQGQMSADNITIIAVGFVVSFICAWIVVKTFLGYVQRHGFALFAWWRVLVGALGLIALALGK
jgi:undecaprenyl-diphosphatase